MLTSWNKPWPPIYAVATIRSASPFKCSSQTFLYCWSLYSANVLPHIVVVQFIFSYSIFLHLPNLTCRLLPFSHRCMGSVGDSHFLFHSKVVCFANQLVLYQWSWRVELSYEASHSSDALLDQPTIQINRGIFSANSSKSSVNSPLHVSSLVAPNSKCFSFRPKPPQVRAYKQTASSHSLTF